jgi:electron transfer flavoprotein alpha subunit
LAGTREIWVFSEKEDLLAELIAGGHQLAEQYGSTVAAFVLGERSQVEEALAHGAQRVLWLGERKADDLVDDYVPTLVDAVEKFAACRTDNRGNATGSCHRRRALQLVWIQLHLPM